MPDDTPDVLTGDRMRLQQVLLNLAGNAIKFTERGDIEITVEQFEISNFKSEVSNPQAAICDLRFAVRNTGIGIPPAALERLFQPFAQADPSMARRFGGTGLGLSICKNLVEMMGGRVWAESKEGKGSTFYFTVRLPLAKELPADFGTPLVLPATAGTQLRILLAEDNPANQKLATYILRDRGHAVEIADDGQAAIDLSARNRYDVILMDVQMPGLNGLEATAAIRKREDGRPRIPIIAMTAHAMKGDREQCLAAGMDAYLSKPIDGHEMIALVETLAAGSPALADGSVSTSATPAPATPLSTAAVLDLESALKRRKAEQRLHLGIARPALAVSETDVRALVHELQVHQIELEMQNEELQRAQEAAREAVEAKRADESAVGNRVLGEIEANMSREVREPAMAITPAAVVFDPELAFSRCCGIQDMLREMIQCFFDEVENLLPKMRVALENGDLAEVGRLGHRMKGTVLYLGAEPAKEAALRVERFCKCEGGTPAEAEAAIDALEQECLALRAALTKHPLAAEAKPGD